MKIVFFGSGDFSEKVLSGLISDGQEIIAVVSQPDKVNARNNKILFSPVKNFCLEKHIPIFQFEKLNKEGEETLKSLNPDLFLTASYGQIIRKNILDIPRFGTINVHTSLLPKYRGATPVQSAILNGDKVTGVTIMKTELGLDTGDICLKKEIAITDTDTASSVFNKLSTLAVDCLHEFFLMFDYYMTHAEKQDETKATYSKKIEKSDLLLDFNMNAIDLTNRVRALEECYFVYKSLRYKVCFAVPSKMTGKVGEILACNSKSGLIIAVKDFSIEIKTIQPESKNKMDAKNYMNSNKFVLGDIIGNS